MFKYNIGPLANNTKRKHILGSKKKSMHFVFGYFPLPIMPNVHVFGTKIKIRTSTYFKFQCH